MRTEQLNVLSHARSRGRGKPGGLTPFPAPPPPPQYFNTDRSKAVLLYFGSATMLATYFVNYR